MRVHKTLAPGWPGFAAALCLVLLSPSANALPTGSELQNALAQGQVSAFALAPVLAPSISNLWTPVPVWNSSGAAPAYRSIGKAEDFSADPDAPSFDIGGYNAMWDDTKFSEISAYGGLGRDALRVAGMRALDGSDGVSGPILYGHLAVERHFFDGQDQLALGTYGTQASVRPTAISGFGDDSYTDVALDGTWRWLAHPERSVSDMVSAHVLVLHEGENLIASHAVFGTRPTDDLTVIRGDASWSWGGDVTPTVQYFQITGSSDPVRLGTLDGSPDSRGWITELNFLPSDDARSPLQGFNVRLSLQFIAYSEFDGSSRDASQNNTVLLHLSANLEPDP